MDWIGPGAVDELFELDVVRRPTHDAVPDEASAVDDRDNAQTFQVVKFVVTVGKSTSFTTYYHWLPRTKSLVAQVNNPQIPAGYRQVGTPK